MQKERERLYPTSVRLPESVKNALEKRAEKEGRSLSNLILYAVREYLRQQQQDGTSLN